jgi:membrane protein DedA with SNARE-associated domain
MNFFHSIEQAFQVFAHAVPLEIFVSVGSFVEEVVSPIPSTLVMGFAGSVAAARHEPILFLFWLSLLGNFGKIFGAWIYYVVGDKLEDVVVRRYGRYFGVEHAQIESIGKRFTGGWKDSLALFILRLLPFIPTTPVSIACGMIRMRLPEFLSITYVASFVKDIGYLFAGYYGIAALRRFLRHVAELRFHVGILIAAGIVVGLFLLWYHRRKGVWLWERCVMRFRSGMTKNE